MATKYFVLYIIVLFLIAAQVGGIETNNGSYDLEQSSNIEENLIIDSIVIENRNIFDTGNPRYKHFIFKLTNKLHVVTREKVIQRELLFKKGDNYPNELVEETERNLRNHLQLYDAWIETDTLPNGHLLVRVVTIDEWTLAVGPNYSREGNENLFELTLTDRNLFGRNQYLSAGYFFREFDDDYENARFIDNKLWGKSFSLDVYHTSNPKNKENWLNLSKPFYSLNQKFSYYMNLNYSDRIDEKYDDTVKIGEIGYLGDSFHLGASYRGGSYKNKMEYFSSYTYRYSNSTGAKFFTDNSQDSIKVKSNISKDSTYHQFNFGLKASFLSFKKFRQIEGLGHIEDFTFGQVFSLAIGRAFNPDFNDYLYDIVSLNLWHGISPGNNIIYIAYNRKHWFYNSSHIRKLSNMSLLFYNKSFDFITFAFHSSYYSDWRAGVDNKSLNLGGSTGIRGYDKYFRTGDRQMVVNSEMRFFTGLEILSVKLGSAVFVDAGRSWKSDEPLKYRDFLFSVGAGLRLSIGNTSRKKIIRLDFAYSEPSGWQISIGTEQYFHLTENSFFLTTY